MLAAPLSPHSSFWSVFTCRKHREVDQGSVELRHLAYLCNKTSHMQGKKTWDFQQRWRPTARFTHTCRKKNVGYPRKDGDTLIPPRVVRCRPGLEPIGNECVPLPRQREALGTKNVLVIHLRRSLPSSGVSGSPIISALLLPILVAF